MDFLWQLVINQILKFLKIGSKWIVPVISKQFRVLLKQMSKEFLQRAMCRIKYIGRLLLLQARVVWLHWTLSDICLSKANHIYFLLIFYFLPLYLSNVSKRKKI